MVSYYHFLFPASTAFHALELGFRTILIEDASRGIQEENITATFARVKAEHGCVVNSSEVKAMVQGRDRRPELGYKLALECRKNINYPMKNKNSKFNGANVNLDGTLVKITVSSKVHFMISNFIMQPSPVELCSSNR